MDDDINSAEIEMVLRNIKIGKLLARTFPVDVWKILGRSGEYFLKEALNKINDEEKIPDMLRKSILRSIFKYT